MRSKIHSNFRQQCAFNFSEISEPFKQYYVVDVNVYYNPDKSVAKYEIINLVDSIQINTVKQKDLFNDKD